MRRWIAMLLCVVLVLGIMCLTSCDDLRGVFGPAGDFFAPTDDNKEPTAEETNPPILETDPPEPTKPLPTLDEADAKAPAYLPDGTFGVPANVKDYVLNQTTKTLTVPKNILHLEEKVSAQNKKLTEEATILQYELDGDIVSWKKEGGYLYVLTKGNNRLLVINPADMSLVAYAPLMGAPAEINIIGEYIYVSLPTLYRIDIFRKQDCAQGPSISLGREVSSFQILGNYIYYCEDDQHCYVYRKNLRTDEEIRCRRGSAYEPKILLNVEENVLIIGESGSSRSMVYYVDMRTMEELWLFTPDNYNNTREMLLVDGKIYWSSYCLSATADGGILGRYGSNDIQMSMCGASENWVVTREGLFIADTYECVADFNATGFKYFHMLLDEENNTLFFAGNSRVAEVQNNVICVLRYADGN